MHARFALVLPAVLAICASAPALATPDGGAPRARKPRVDREAEALERSIAAKLLEVKAGSSEGGGLEARRPSTTLDDWASGRPLGPGPYSLTLDLRPQQTYGLALEAARDALRRISLRSCESSIGAVREGSMPPGEVTLRFGLDGAVLEARTGLWYGSKPLERCVIQALRAIRLRPASPPGPRAIGVLVGLASPSRAGGGGGAGPLPSDRRPRAADQPSIPGSGARLALWVDRDETRGLRVFEAQRTLRGASLDACVTAAGRPDAASTPGTFLLALSADGTVREASVAAWSGSTALEACVRTALAALRFAATDEPEPRQVAVRVHVNPPRPIPQGGDGGTSGPR